MSEEAIRTLTAYDWPGNVRELRHTLENACVMSSVEVLDVADLALPSPGIAVAEEPLRDDDLHLATHVARTERRVITRALESAKGNRAHAARLLGIRRALLYARMKELGLGEPGDEGGGTLFVRPCTKSVHSRPLRVARSFLRFDVEAARRNHPPISAALRRSLGDLWRAPC